jgi:hypothetical protein
MGPDLLAEGQPSAGEGAQRSSCRRGGVELVARTPSAGSQGPLAGGEGPQLVANGVGGGEDQILDLVAAWVRAFTAERRTTWTARIDSTMPLLVLGTTLASPERTARVAASASVGSDLPRRRRC